MNINSIIFAVIAGILTFIIEGEPSGLLVTNILIGSIAGKLLD
ncbi:hypothetical protein [Lederbergia citri]|nr:hypothetical protein [Lederbergia citri]